MDMDVCNAKDSLDKKRKRKQKRRGNTARGDHRGCDPAEDSASTDNVVSQESPKIICLNLEPGMGQSPSEENLQREKNEKKHNAVQCGEASGISVLTILNVKVLKEEDETSISLNADFCSADGKENSLLSEEPDGNGTNLIKRDDEHTETTDHLDPSSDVEVQRIKKKKRRRRRRRSLESPKKSFESNVEDEKTVALPSHLDEVETTNHLKKIATEEVMNRVSLEESIDCSVSEKTELLSSNAKESSMVLADPHKSKDCENTTVIEKDNDCLENKDCLAQLNGGDTHGITKTEQKKGRRKRKFADTLEGSLKSDVEDCKKDATFNCLNEVETTSLHEHSTSTEIVKIVSVEEVSIDCPVEEFPSDMKKIEQTIKQKVPCLLACDATNDNVEVQWIKKRKRRRRRRSLESPKNSFESNMEDEKKVALPSYLNEVETTSHLKIFATEEVKIGVSLEESIDCSVSEKTELLSANAKESSMVLADPHKSKDCENTTMIKKDNDCLGTKDGLAQLNSGDNIHGITKTEQKKGRRKRKFADTLERSLKSDVEDCKKDATVNCLNEVETTSLHEHSTSTEIVKIVSVEEVSIDCPVEEFPSDMKKREQTIKQKVPCLLACDATNDNVEGQWIKKRKRRRRRRSLESPKKSFESNMEDEKKVALPSHLNEVETTSHLKNFATEEVKIGVSLEESIDCSVSEKTELLSANAKESSMVLADPHKSKDCENTTMIKKDNDCLGTKDCLAQLNSGDDIHDITKTEQKKGRRKRKFADTLERSLKPDVEVCKKDATFNCLNEVETTSLHEHSTSTEIVKNVLVDEVSIDSSVGELPSHMKKREQTIKRKVSRLLACDATNDNVGAVLEKNSFSQISNSSNERDATGCSKKKLLILDVNGLLVDFVPYFPDGYTPDIIISNKAVFKRPFCDDFLQFCFERFEVGIWSSRIWRNLNMLIKFLMRDSRHKLLFCWDQSHCTTTRFTTIENDRKPLVLKELRRIWENLEPNLPWKRGEYDESNTLLLDDSPYKALRNPANTAVFPTTYRYKDSNDTSLGPGGDLRTYLEGVSVAENVRKYVEQNPFGQQPISESNPSWKFYRKIINSEER